MTTLRCQCCADALLPTARALVCAACHNSAIIRHCRVYCALHDTVLDPTVRSPLQSATADVATGAAVVLTTTTELDSKTKDAIRAEWNKLLFPPRPLAFHTIGDLYDHGN